MTDKETKILELIQQGCTYLHIQSVVGVSPAKISAVKKKYFIAKSENNIQNTTVIQPQNEENTTEIPKNEEDATILSQNEEDTTENLNINANNGSDTTITGLEKSKNTITNPKKLKTMSYNYTDDEEPREFSEEFELEKLKLENEHEIKMRQIEKEENEQEIKDRELRIEEAKLEAERRKTEKQELEILFKFRKLVKNCLEGDGEDWEEYEAIDFYNKVVDLSEKVEEYCFVNKIDQEGLKILAILEQIATAFDEFTDNMGSSDELTLDDDLKELLEMVEEVDFDSYV